MPDDGSHGRLFVKRRIGESVRIGDAVVTVWRRRGNRIDLRIEAPRQLPIEIIDGREEAQPKRRR